MFGHVFELGGPWKLRRGPMRERLRITHLGKYYAPVRGGIESHVRDLAGAQSKLGADVQVVCMSHDSRWTRVEWDGGVRVVRVGCWASVGKLDVCPELPGVVGSIAADIIHVHVPNPAMVLAVLASRPRGRCVVGYHSDHVNQPVARHVFRPVEKAFLRGVDRILTTSPSYADASDLLPAYVDRLDTLPLGIDRAAEVPSAGVRDEAARLRARYGSPLWFFCGRLVPYKGLVHAVHAMRHAPGTLLVAGEGPERPRLERETQRLGVADRVRFLGVVGDVRPYYCAADAFWLPSTNRSEAFGVVQLEAMSMGCPVLNTNIHGSGVPWVSQHGISGLTVPPGDPRALAAAAVRLAGDVQLQQRLSKGAERRAREFDLESMARRAIDIYRRALELG